MAPTSEAKNSTGLIVLILIVRRIFLLSNILQPTRPNGINY